MPSSGRLKDKSEASGLHLLQAGFKNIVSQILDMNRYCTIDNWFCERLRRFSLTMSSSQYIC